MRNSTSTNFFESSSVLIKVSIVYPNSPFPNGGIYGLQREKKRLLVLPCRCMWSWMRKQLCNVQVCGPVHFLVGEAEIKGKVYSLPLTINGKTQIEQHMLGSKHLGLLRIGTQLGWLKPIGVVVVQSWYLDLKKKKNDMHLNSGCHNHCSQRGTYSYPIPSNGTTTSPTSPAPLSQLMYDSFQS